MALFLNDKEKKAREAALSRPEREIVFNKRPDRIGSYLKKHLDKFVFDEFSNSYLKKAEGKLDFLKGVPIPLRAEDVKEFHSDVGLSVLIIAENMAWIIGIDPKFKYADQYIEYMKMNFGKKIDEYISKEAKDAGELEKYDEACIHFRASLCVHFDYLDSMYGYARCLKKMYEDSNDETYIGNFKAEAFEYFELTTEIHPRFAQAYYYLGYMYLNMGLYAKAKLVWDEFLNRSKNGKDKKEIKQRLKQIAAPLEVEKGYNHVLAQRWEEGIEILEPYLETEYRDWWPLSYYLGVAYISAGRRDEAVISLKNVLKMNPSHIETMEELADIFEVEGKKDQVKKYRDKILLLKKGGYEEPSQAKELTEPEETESIIEEDELSVVDKKGVKKLKKLEKKDE